MKKFIFLFCFFIFNSFCQQISERIEKSILKEYNFQNIQVIISKTGPFLVKKDGKEILSGGFWLGQGVIKEEGKTRFTHEEWQFNDYRGKLKGEIISETPLTIKIDSRDLAKDSIGFLEEIRIIDKTINLKYEFSINKKTDYPVSIYVNFSFPEDIIDKDIKPFIDEEKAIYETKKGSVTISYSSDFSPDRFNVNLYKNFRVYIRFPSGLKKGEIKKGEINITLP